MKEIGKVFNNKWTLKKKIASGAFGDVVLGKFFKNYSKIIKFISN